MKQFHHFPKTTGIVSHGKKLWRTIWFPTLNIPWEIHISSGTYKVRIKIDEKYFSWMGVYFSDRKGSEVHAFGMKWEHRYWKVVTITFLQKIRENKKFENIELLKKQLYQDKRRCLTHIWNVCTFGSFDLIHPGHISYLEHAKQQWDNLSTIVASNESIKKFKNHPPKYSQHQRIKYLHELWVIDTIIPWDPVDFYITLQTLQPQVLVFWYDQNMQWVESRYNNQWIPVPFLIKAQAHHPEVYKSSKLKATL